MKKNIQLLLDNGLEVYIPILKCKNCGTIITEYNHPLPFKKVDSVQYHKCSCLDNIEDEFESYGLLEQIGYRTPIIKE